MSRTVIASFLATVGLVVPAAWHLLDADVQHDGKKLRPLQQQLMIDGARVTLDVDRNLVITGDKVTARLRAYSDTPKKVAIDLRLLQSNNYAGERVESPSVPIDRESFVLDARPDGGPEVTTQLVLGTRPSTLAMTDTFKVYISPHGDKPAKEEGYGDNRRDYRTPVEEGRAAAIGIMGWSGSSLAMRIVPEGPIVHGQPFTVAVHVKNTSGHRLPRVPWPSLATQVELEGGLGAGAYTIDNLDEDDDPAHDHAFKRNQDYVRRFRVTPNADAPRVTELALVASAEAWDENGPPSPVIAGGMEVKAFPIVDKSPSTVAAK